MKASVSIEWECKSCGSINAHTKPIADVSEVDGVFTHVVAKASTGSIACSNCGEVSSFEVSETSVSTW